MSGARYTPPRPHPQPLVVSWDADGKPLKMIGIDIELSRRRQAHDPIRRVLPVTHLHRPHRAEHALGGPVKR
jgi:hypothetical protein